MHSMVHINSKKLLHAITSVCKILDKPYTSKLLKFNLYDCALKVFLAYLIKCQMSIYIVDYRKNL